MTFDTTGINWLAVLAADVAGFILGGIWFGVLFTKAWVAAYGFTEAEVQASKKNTARNFLTYLVMGFVICLALAMLFRALNVTEINAAVQTAAFCGVGFVATVLLMQVMSGGRKIAAWFIDGLYYVLWFILAGVILAAMK